MKKSFEVAITKTLRVEFDSTKLTDEFWRDFNEMISDRGGPDIEYLAEHVGWNYVQGYEKFIEGIGEIKEMGISIEERSDGVEVQSL